MDAYTTEEEQIAKIKKWWGENGKAIILGLVLGLSGLFGYRYWESARTVEGQNASINYEHLLSIASNGASDEATTAGQAIIAGYPKSTYARLSALVLAKLAVDVRDFEEAKLRLQWVIDNSKEGKIKPMAQARMGQVLLAEGNVDAASSLVAEIDPAYADLFTELRGDVLFASGETEQARALYEQTLDEALKRGNSGAIVQLKIDNLNVATQ
ncbi:MAG: putative negative regulator of RcsB-dependent stress response [Gammaproteobacteria bacterium]